jgi:hypothetical protein
MLPCPISVYRQEGRPSSDCFLPELLTFSWEGMKPIANEVETAVLAIITEATKEALNGPLKKVAMRRFHREWLTKDVPVH